MKKHLLLVCAVTAAMASFSLSQDKQRSNDTVSTATKAQSSEVVVTPVSVTWKRARPGQEFAVLSGNPQAEGSPFVIRLRLDDGVIIPPHWHPVDEHLTILTGALYMGMGEKLDEAAARVMPAGSYVLIPKETRHFVRAKGQTIIQIHGIGPFKTYWVDQRDEQKGKQGQ